MSLQHLIYVQGLSAVNMSLQHLIYVQVLSALDDVVSASGMYKYQHASAGNQVSTVYIECVLYRMCSL